MRAARLSSVLLALGLLLLQGCGSDPADADDDGPKGVGTLPLLPGCRAHLQGTLVQHPVTLAAPPVRRDGASVLTGEWTEPVKLTRFLSTDWVEVPCGAPSASVEFTQLQAEGRLSPQVRVVVPPSGSDPGDTVLLSPEPPLLDDPTLGPTFPVTTTGGFSTTLLPDTPVADVCLTGQTLFPVAPFSLPAQAGLPSSGFQATTASGTYAYSPALDWDAPAVAFELEDAAVVLVCDSGWSLGGGYQLTFEEEVEDVVKAKAQHDFWFEGELALQEDDTTVLGYYRLYDIAVEVSGNLTGSYSGPTERLIPVTGFFEKDVEGKAYLDLPLFDTGGVTWSFTLDVLGTPVSENNPRILEDHLERLNLTLPPSPSRPGYFRLSAQGQEDTVSYFHPEGFVIANWGLYRRVAEE